MSIPDTKLYSMGMEYSMWGQIGQPHTQGLSSCKEKEKTLDTRLWMGLVAMHFKMNSTQLK